LRLLEDFAGVQSSRFGLHLGCLR